MKKILVAGFITILSITSIFAQSDLQPLATVKLHKTESITLKQLKERVAMFEKQTGQANFTVEQKKEILDTLINETLLFQAASKTGMTLTDSLIDQIFVQSIPSLFGIQVTEQQLVDLVRQQYNMTLDQYFLDNAGMSAKEYKKNLAKNAMSQQYVLSVKEAQLREQAVPTDAEIRSYYDMNKANLVQTDVLEFFLVVVPKNNNSADAKNRANEIRTDLRSGKVTEEELKLKTTNQADSEYLVGVQYMAKDPTAAQQLGMDYAKFAELFTKNAGYTTDVTETATDYQFFMIKDVHEAKMLKLDDLVQPGTTTTVYEYIREGLSQQKLAGAAQIAVEEVVADLRKPENFTILKTDSALNTLLDW